MDRKTSSDAAQPSHSRPVVWVMWLIAWPPIGFIAFLIVFVALTLMVMSVAGGESQADSAAGVAFFLSIVVLAVFFFVVASQMVKREDVHSRVGGKTLFIYTSLGLLLGLLIMFFAATSPQTEEFYSESETPTVQDSSGQHDLSQNPELLGVLTDIGATEISDLNIDYVDRLDNQDWLAVYSPYTWSNDNSFAYGEIKVLRRQESRQMLYRVVAHEYLHHIWASKMDEGTKDNLTSHLITIHGRNSYMQQRVSDYSHQGTLLPTEIFAFACTEFSDYWLTSYVIDECNKYIRRSSLTMVF